MPTGYAIATIILLLVLLTFAYGGLSAAPWVPTRSGDVDRFLRLAALKPGQKFYDLGCGDGRLVIAAAEAGAVAKGFEVSLLPYLLSKFRLLFQRTRGAEVRYGDFWRHPLSEADVVYFFLMPKVYPKLKSKFEHELKPGTKIISYVWKIDDWQPIAVDVMKNRPNLYLYKI